MSLIDVDKLNEAGDLALKGMRAMLSGMISAEELGRLAYAAHATVRPEDIKIRGRIANIHAMAEQSRKSLSSEPV